jgi:hypothetical protein
MIFRIGHADILEHSAASGFVSLLAHGFIPLAGCPMSRRFCETWEFLFFPALPPVFTNLRSKPNWIPIRLSVDPQVSQQRRDLGHPAPSGWMRSISLGHPPGSHDVNAT